MAFSVAAFRRAFTPWAFDWRGGTYVARDVSAVRVARYLGDAERSPAHALEALLREAFPRPRLGSRAWWRWRRHGDPVSVLLTLPPAVRGVVLEDFFRLARDPVLDALEASAPAGEDTPDPSEDPAGAAYLHDLERLNRDPYATRAARCAVELALLHVERFYGAGCVHNPARWRTADGWIPSRVLWLYWHGIARVRAWERLEYLRQQALGTGDASRAADRAATLFHDAFAA